MIELIALKHFAKVVNSRIGTTCSNFRNRKIFVFLRHKYKIVDSLRVCPDQNKNMKKIETVLSKNDCESETLLPFTIIKV